MPPATSARSASSHSAASYSILKPAADMLSMFFSHFLVRLSGFASRGILTLLGLLNIVIYRVFFSVLRIRIYYYADPESKKLSI